MSKESFLKKKVQFRGEARNINKVFIDIEKYPLIYDNFLLTHD